MLVPVDGPRQAMVFRLVAEQTQVTGTVLVLKACRRYLVGGVVHQAEQRQAGTALFQPGMAASIHLQEHAFLLPPFRRERYFCGLRFCGERMPASRRMRCTLGRLSTRPSTPVSFSCRWLSLKPAYLPRASSSARGRVRGGNRVHRRPSLIAVLYPTGVPLVVSPLQSLDLPLAQVQILRCFPYGDPPRDRVLDHFDCLYLFLAQRHSLLSAEVTESLSS